MPRYIAVKDKRNQLGARDYCNSTKINGTLCSFQNESDWQKIIELIETVEYPETNRNMSYWTDLKLDGQSVEFMNRENASFARTMNINDDRNSTCVVANSTGGLHSWPCSEEEYFICETGKEYNNTQGICKVLFIDSKSVWREIFLSIAKRTVTTELIKATSYQGSLYSTLKHDS